MATAVSYAIFLTDQARVVTLQAQYPNGIQIPPNTAAAMFGLPAIGSGLIGTAGYIGIFPEDSIGFAPDLTASYGTESFSLTYNGGNGGAPGGGFPNPYPTTLSCFWIGYFLYAGASGTTSPPAANPRYQGTRRWCDGFESPQLGEGGSGNGGRRYSRDASRTPDGMGFAIRSQNSIVRTHTLPLPRPTVSWERFYVRLRVLPTGGDDNIWYLGASVDAGPAFLVNVNTSGTLQGYGLGNAAYPGQSLGTTAALTLNVWYRIDMRLELLASPSTQNAKMDFYLNGSLIFSGTSTNPSQGQGHSTSNVGEYAGATNHGLECDIDDWVSADEVSVGGTKYPGLDLTSGSHIIIARPNGFGTGHSTASWLGVGTAIPGSWQEVNNLGDTAGATTGLSTTVNGATIVLNTDFVKQQSGVASIAVGWYAFALGGAIGTNVKYGIVGQPLAAVTLPAQWGATPNIYSIASGATSDALPDIGPIVLTLTTGTGSGGNMTLVAFFATVENIGAWGPEDASPVSQWTGFFTRLGPHNSSYPTLQANNTQVAPIQAVRVAAGVYTGNTIGQDILSNIAPHWWYVRRVGASVGGFWYSSMFDAHTFVVEKVQPELMTQSKIAGTQSIGGSGTSDNASAVYQYVAVSDIAMRFLLNGAFAHKSTVASFANSLLDSGFTPDNVFLFIEDYTAGTSGHYYKGPGHTSDNASPLDATQAAGIATLAAGTITSKTAIHTDQPQTAYSAWRKSDGSGAAQWFDCGSYTGNASGADRDIAISINGKFPLLVIVSPHNAASFVRDPSHLTNNSLQIGVGNSTTGIVGGGANKFTVNNSLNAGGIVYDYFVIGGGSSWTNPTNPFTPAVETPRGPGIWPAAPVQTTISPITLTVPAQWRVHRMDLKPRPEEHL